MAQRMLPHTNRFAGISVREQLITADTLSKPSGGINP